MPAILIPERRGAVLVQRLELHEANLSMLKCLSLQSSDPNHQKVQRAALLNVEHHVLKPAIYDPMAERSDACNH